jgi:hypothetical protein
MTEETKSGHKTRLRSAAAVLKNSLRAEPGHYDLQLPRAKAIELFQRHVGLVEVETTSYCNRTCSFCPNSFIDRRSKKHPMPEPVWERILDDLRVLDYSGSFFWCRYSEPTSEERLVERIRQVRRVAPKARIGIDSNGDYLDEDYLNRLIEAGLNRLWIDIYMPDDEPYETAITEAHHARFLKRINKTAVVGTTYPELISKVDVAGLDMWATVRNFASLKRVDLSGRGGLIQIARRTTRVSPCYAPFKNLVIDWDGSVVICCQVRSDSAPQKDSVVAKIGENGTGLIDAYVALGAWRNALKGFGPKPAPCGTCNVFEYHPTKPARIISQLFAEEKLPGARLVKGVASRVIGRTIRH